MFFIFFLVVGDDVFVVGLFLLELLLEFGLEFEDYFVTLLLTLEVAGGVFCQFLVVVFLFVLFCSGLVLKRGF